jgi:hypothetical protein
MHLTLNITIIVKKLITLFFVNNLNLINIAMIVLINEIK